MPGVYLLPTGCFHIISAQLSHFCSPWLSSLLGCGWLSSRAEMQGNVKSGLENLLSLGWAYTGVFVGNWVAIGVVLSLPWLPCLWSKPVLADSS